MARLTPLTWEEHITLGRELHGILDRMTALHMQVSRAYGVTSKEQNRSAKVVSALNQLRSDLDNRVIAEHPSREDSELTHIYYPGPTPKN